MTVYTVRKRSVTGVGKRGRAIRHLKGCIYVPSAMIHSRVTVIPAEEYAELKRYMRKLIRIYDMVKNGIDS
jgi:hypothetical protein